MVSMLRVVITRVFIFCLFVRCEFIIVSKVYCYWKFDSSSSAYTTCDTHTVYIKIYRYTQYIHTYIFIIFLL